MKTSVSKRILSVLCLLLAILLISCNPGGERNTTSTAAVSTTPPSLTTAQQTTAATTAGTAATTVGTTTTTSSEDENAEPTWILNTTNRRTYTWTDISVWQRELTIPTTKGGDPIVISHLTDTHIIYYSKEDLADPFYKSVYDAYNNPSVNGWPLSNVKWTMREAVVGADAVVVTGDVMSAYSPGALAKANEYIFSKHANVMATLGNHDLARTDVHASIRDPMSKEELRAELAAGWCNDITYASQVLGEKVMLITMDNGIGFHNEQSPLLSYDLQLAREEGYIVLLFFHVPLNTGRVEDNNIPPEWGNHPNWSFGTMDGYAGPNSTGADAKIYSTICKNGDIIKGIFCGHVHGDFYLEIPAKTIDGEDTMIPQYVMTPVMSDSGHYLRITVE